MKRAWLLLLCLLAGCGFGPSDGPSNYDVIRFTPGDGVFGTWDAEVYPVYWAEMERCSGRRGDYGAVRWYVLADSAAEVMRTPKGLRVGIYFQDENAILLLRWTMDVPDIVRHEMLHALIKQPGHPAVFDTCGVRLGGT